MEQTKSKVEKLELVYAKIDKLIKWTLVSSSLVYLILLALTKEVGRYNSQIVHGLRDNLSYCGLVLLVSAISALIYKLLYLKYHKRYQYTKLDIKPIEDEELFVKRWIKKPYFFARLSVIVHFVNLLIIILAILSSL